MKKVLLLMLPLLLLLMPGFSYADVSVSGTGIKQVGKTLTQADDITRVVFDNLSVSNCSNCGGVSTLQDAYEGGATITTDATNDEIIFKYGGDNGVIQSWQKNDGTPVFEIITSTVLPSSGSVVQMTYTSTGLTNSNSTTIGDENKAIGISGGDIKFSLTHTPLRESNCLEITSKLLVGHSGSTGHFAAGIFAFDNTTAFAVTSHANPGSGKATPLFVHGVIDPIGTLNDVNVKVNVGNTVAGTTYFNSRDTGPAGYYGNTHDSFLKIEEKVKCGN